DDGGLSSDTGDDNDNDNDNDDEDDSDEEFVDALSDASPGVSPGVGAGTKPLLDVYIPPSEDLFAPAVPPVAVGASHNQRQGQGQGPRPPFNLPELNILPSSPATPTPGASLPTAVPLFPSSASHAVGDDTPRASAGFAQPSPAATSTSRFNPKKLVRKFPGLGGGGGGGGVGQAPASPAVDVQGNLVPPGAKRARSHQGSSEKKADKEKEKDKEKEGEKEKDKEERRSKFGGQRWREGSGSGGSGSVSPSAGSGSDTGVVAGGAGTGAGAGRRPGKLRGAGRRKSDFEFKGGKNDIVGIVMLEIQGADDLPRLANMTRTGWDMDPFVVISFGKKVFRTRVIRHSRNPVWDEKLLFHVRRYETSFKVQLSVLDWDKLSSNDHIGDVYFDVNELVRSAPQPDAETGLYPVGGEEGEKGAEGMREYSLPLSTAKEMKWEAKHNPVIRFKAKYQPYDALRQRFWRQYLTQYDTDNTCALSYLELRAMLDSLGSTLTSATVSSFFTRYGKRPHEDEISIEQAVMCLEEELGRPEGEKKRVGGSGDAGEGGDGDGGDGELSTSAVTPVVGALGPRGEELALELDKLDFAGPVNHAREEEGAYTTEPMQMPLRDAAAGLDPMMVPTTPDLSSDDMDAEEMAGVGAGAGAGNTSPLLAPGAPVPVKTAKRNKLRFRRALSKKNTGDSFTSAAPSSSTSPEPRLRFRRALSKKNTGDSFTSAAPSSSTSSSPSSSPNHPETMDSSLSSEDPNPVERIINVKNCPLCHRPRLNSKAEMDIVTHLAVCASGDWGKVDRIVVGNFVTASQAQRKWYTKVLGRVGGGDYRIGANSANIIVQNRMTGQLEEEKMQVYVRLGIRLLYKGASSRMEGGRARRLLKSLSIKQGIKYDDPESAKEIPAFIEFHGLKVDEILDPLDSFKTFNQFFYRKLKPSARPIECPTDPYRLVSAADCRLMTFATVSEATRLWIKGREFSVARLLGEHYKAEAERYVGGALAIFRLAPQDYHRFHSPVDGKVGAMMDIEGEYYTVNPQAIRSALDVYGENARKIVPIDSPQFGRVFAVCVGAMMVGSIKTTVQEGEWISRGQEFGYFAFGGSTIVILFEKGRVEWDEDLLINGRASLETLVRVGMGIGRGKPLPSASPLPSPSMQGATITDV
ncbi:hypothetical protein CVT25_005520, partial [Psilocybe cyanescens]